jgi:hypothetical protein
MPPSKTEKLNVFINNKTIGQNGAGIFEIDDSL